MLTVNQRKIVILSDDASFSAQLCDRWQSERVLPAFTVLQGEGTRALAPESMDLAVIDLPRADAHRAARRACELSSKPVLLMCGDANTMQSVRRESPRRIIFSARLSVPARPLSARNARTLFRRIPGSIGTQELSCRQNNSQNKQRNT